MDDAGQTTRSTTDIDKLVGKRLHQARVLLGYSQQTVGDALGVSFQQVQKYEKGVNRLSVARLVQLSKLLNKPVNWFVDQTDTSPEPHDMTIWEAKRFLQLQVKKLLAVVRAADAISKAKTNLNRHLAIVKLDGALNEFKSSYCLAARIKLECRHSMHAKLRRCCAVS